MAELNYVRAVNQALGDALGADERVIVLGEDVAAAGGPFKATRGLLEKFGRDRVRDTPISEGAIVGTAVGCALSGLRPVVEIMFMDFTTLAMDAIVNQAAKARFMFGGQTSVPMVLRTPHGGGLSAGPQHSQCLESWYAHVPGLKVVCPSNAADAYSLLRAAIDDDDPVVFVENKALYGRKSDVPEEPTKVALGKANIARTGRDATIVTYGATVHQALKAADTLANDADVEVIDLRSLQPWDEQLVLDSLRRTHRMVIAHEAVEAFGVGAEIAARMADIGFDELDAPIVRVGAPFMPVPFAKELERSYQPDAERIIAALQRVLQ